MASRFEERLASGVPLVGDGGMGALIMGAVPRLRCPEEANLRAPESVVALHTSFIRAGADLIETNTFGANRRKLSALYLEEELEQINSTGVRLAREAREVSGGEVFIAGAIGPLGEAELFDPAEAAPLFVEQAQVLEGRGVDLLMLETFYDLDELLVAIEAVRGVSRLPLVALMTFDADGQTLGGVSAADAAARLGELDLAAIGANHSAGPAAALNALAEMRRDGVVLAALPNVGLASLAGSRVVFPHATPEYFSEFAAQARSLGAGLIGGCCGTTPAQIAAIRTAVDEARQPTLRSSCASASCWCRPRARARRPSWHGCSARGVRRLGPARPAARGEQRRAARDGPRAGRARRRALCRRQRQSPRPGADERRDGLGGDRARVRDRDDPAPDAARHRNRRARVASPRGARRRRPQHARRDRRPPEEGDYPGARGVYEIEAIGLTRLITGLNRGEDYHGRSIDAPTSFFVGVAVNPSADDLDTELDRFEQKLAAGAQFAMTQVLFDLTFLDAFLAHHGGRSPIPLLVGIWPLRSHQLAVRIHNEVPGIVVPERCRRSCATRGRTPPRPGSSSPAH